MFKLLKLTRPKQKTLNELVACCEGHRKGRVSTEELLELVAQDATSKHWPKHDRTKVKYGKR